MSIPVWPSDLPKPLRAGYQRDRQDIRVRKRGNGPQGYRRKYSAAVEILSLSFELTRSQKAVLDNFYSHATSDGALPFYMPDPATDGWAMLSSSREQMLMPDGTPLLIAKRMLCQFSDNLPSERFVRDLFEVSFSVEVLP